MSGSEARPVRILHISDLHERASYLGMTAQRQALLGWDSEERGYLLGDRFDRELTSLAVKGVDLVCLTGDVADSGHPAEYEVAGKRICEILRLLGVPKERFFAVPGNHDVQREVNKAAWRKVRAWLADSRDASPLGRWFRGVGNRPPGVPGTPEDLLERTDAFWKWLEELRGTRLRSAGPTRLGYRHTLPAGAIGGVDVPIHIIGLDSAWLAGDPTDRGRIVITEEQVQAHVRDGENGLGGVRVALVHHPLDHLADYHGVRRLLADNVDMVLHGHQHVPVSVTVAEPGNQLRLLAAGCLVEGELGKGWPNGFHLIELDPRRRKHAVHFRKWSKDGHFWAKGSDLYAEAPDGVLSLVEQLADNSRFSPGAVSVRDVAGKCPFVAGRPLTPGEAFGRDEDVRFILNRVRSGESVYIHGDPRIGKSTLLNLVVDTAGHRQRGGPEAARWSSALVDAHRTDMTYDRPAFWRDVLFAVDRRSCPDWLSAAIGLAEASPTPGHIERFFRNLEREGWKLIVAIDEVDVLVERPGLDGDFWGHLRSLSSNESGLVLVAASRRPAALLQAAVHGRGSECFNQMTSHELGPFDETAVENLLGQGGLSDQARSFVRSVSGSLPWLLQATATPLWEGQHAQACARLVTAQATVVFPPMLDALMSKDRSAAFTLAVRATYAKWGATASHPPLGGNRLGRLQRRGLADRSGTPPLAFTWWACEHGGSYLQGRHDLPVDEHRRLAAELETIREEVDLDAWARSVWEPA